MVIRENTISSSDARIHNKRLLVLKTLNGRSDESRMKCYVCGSEDCTIKVHQEYCTLCNRQRFLWHEAKRLKHKANKLPTETIFALMNRGELYKVISDQRARLFNKGMGDPTLYSTKVRKQRFIQDILTMTLDELIIEATIQDNKLRG